MNEPPHLPIFFPRVCSYYSINHPVNLMSPLQEIEQLSSCVAALGVFNNYSVIKNFLKLNLEVQTLKPEVSRSQKGHPLNPFKVWQ